MFQVHTFIDRSEYINILLIFMGSTNFISFFHNKFNFKINLIVQKLKILLTFFENDIIEILKLQLF